MVFIHGAGGSIKTWTRQVSSYASHFNLLLIDLRDHGQSKNIKPPHTSYDFEIISRDIKNVLDANEIERAHFVTLSFGSVLIQDFAARYPWFVDKVIFVGAVFTGGWMLRSFVYLAKFFNLFLSYSMMYRLFSYALMPRKENQFARRLYQTQAMKITQDEYMKWLGLYKEFFSLLKSFSNQKLSFPALIVMGATDYIFLKSACRFSSNQDQTTLRKIPEAGHIVNIEAPESFNKISLDFLRPAKGREEIPASTSTCDTSLLSPTV